MVDAVAYVPHLQPDRAAIITNTWTPRESNFLWNDNSWRRCTAKKVYSLICLCFAASRSVEARIFFSFLAARGVW